MKKYITILGVAILGLLSTACRGKESFGSDDITKDRIKLLAPAKSETDKWIEENIRLKYNIDPVWRWTDRENNYSKNLVPPFEKNIVPFLKVIDKAFLDVYVIVRGQDFINTYVPKQFLLIGSNAHNPQDGTITLGQAEGGRKIYFYGVNFWERKGQIYQYLHTMYHEFSHILHQTKFYSEEYEKITASGYTAQWANSNLTEALELGFISPYARASKDEDFVEMIAFYVTLSPEDWAARINSIDGHVAGDLAEKEAKKEGKSDEEAEQIGQAVAANTVTTAKAALQQKLSIIKDYLLLQWQINLDELRNLAQKRIHSVAEEMNKPSGSSPMLLGTYSKVHLYCHMCKHDFSLAPEPSETLNN